MMVSIGWLWFADKDYRYPFLFKGAAAPFFVPACELFKGEFPAPVNTALNPVWGRTQVWYWIFRRYTSLSQKNTPTLAHFCSNRARDKTRLFIQVSIQSGAVVPECTVEPETAAFFLRKLLIPSVILLESDPLPIIIVLQNRGDL